MLQRALNPFNLTNRVVYHFFHGRYKAHQTRRVELQREHSLYSRAIRKSVDWFAGRLPSPGALVFDVGCADGYALELFRNLGFHCCLGGDLNLRSLEIARKFGASVVCMDMHTLPLGRESVDAIFCSHTFEHSLLPARVIRGFERVLRPGGLLFIVVPLNERKRRTRGHPSGFTRKDQLRRLLSPPFDVLEYEEEFSREREIWALCRKRLRAAP